MTKPAARNATASLSPQRILYRSHLFCLFAGGSTYLTVLG